MITPNLQIRSVRVREVNELARGYLASECLLSRNLNFSLADTWPEHLTTIPTIQPSVKASLPVRT